MDSGPQKQQCETHDMQRASMVPDSRRNLAFVALALLFCAGCGEKMPVAAVSGTVTFEGKPLAGASITTQPIATDSRNPGSGSFAQTDDQGHFELELVKPARKGAIIGEHRVIISPSSGVIAERQSKQAADGQKVWTDESVVRGVAADDGWPAKFTDGTLRLQVPPEGANDVRFDLTP